MEDDSENNKHAWRKSASQILNNLQVEENEGLTREEASRRKQKFGLNKLKETEKKSRWKILAEQFKSFLVILLAIAAAVSLIVAHLTPLNQK